MGQKVSCCRKRKFRMIKPFGEERSSCRESFSFSENLKESNTGTPIHNPVSLKLDKVPNESNSEENRLPTRVCPTHKFVPSHKASFLATKWNLAVMVSDSSASASTTHNGGRTPVRRRLTMGVPTPRRFPFFSPSPPPPVEVKNLYVSPELPKPGALSPKDQPELPFEPAQKDMVGMYTCHGLEPDVFTDFGDTMDKINQDQACIMFPVGEAKETAMFGVFDGHGEYGDLISSCAMLFLALHLIPVAKEIGESTERTEKALKSAFEKSNKQLKESDNLDAVYSGTTACIAFLKAPTLIVAWVGDSRLILAHRRKGESPLNKVKGVPRAGRCQSRALTWDQKPDVPYELKRIVTAGGYVSIVSEKEDAVSRVWLDEEMTQIGLSLSRSLGDHAVANAGVTAEPAITEVHLTEKDEFLIIATDGIWEFFSNQEAVDLVDKELVAGKSASEACRTLIEEAKHRWRINEGDYCDDITAIVLKLPLAFGVEAGKKARHSLENVESDLTDPFVDFPSSSREYDIENGRIIEEASNVSCVPTIQC